MPLSDIVRPVYTEQVTVSNPGRFMEGGLMRPSMVFPYLSQKKLALLAISLATIAVGCASTSHPGARQGEIAFATVGAFTGPDAYFGITEIAGCYPAALLINHDSGVLGHTVTCKPVDTKQDEADTPPAIAQLLATTPSLAGVLGAAPITVAVPLLNRAQVTMFETDGDPAFDRSTYKYFWRIIPGDDVAGAAMAAWAHMAGFTRGAAVFGNDPTSQSTVASLVRGFTKLGGRIAPNIQIAPDQTSYRSEVENVLAAHPQVIFTEADPQSSATFFSEFKQLRGSMLPVSATNVALTPQWFNAVSKAVGVQTFVKAFTAVNPVAAISGPAWATYNSALLASSSQVRNPSQYSTQAYSEDMYDSVNIMALAMIKAKSVSPKQYNDQIVNVTTPRAGAVIVHTFAAGKRALLAGHQIQYVGPSGAVLFDKYHNAPGLFAIVGWNGKGSNHTIRIITAAEISAAR